MKINSEIFEKISNGDPKNAALFIEVVENSYSIYALGAGLKLELLQLRLFEAWESWCHDMHHMAKSSMSNSSPNTDAKPDHFKYAGTLAFWLRRTSPIAMDKIEQLHQDTHSIEGKDQKFIVDFGNEYLAFLLGLEFCNFFEGNKGPPISEDYIQMLCYFLKYKHVSPHAMVMIYRSLFLNL